jgi:hypothetical protein
VGSVEELRATPPDRFLVEPPDLEEQEELRRADFASRADGVFAEIPSDVSTARSCGSALPSSRRATAGSARSSIPSSDRRPDLTTRVYRSAAVLSEWRAAERRLVELDPGDDEARGLGDQIARLREQHGYLFDHKRGRPGGAAR